MLVVLAVMVMLAEPLKDVPLIVRAVCRVVAVPALPVTLVVIDVLESVPVTLVYVDRSVTSATVQSLQYASLAPECENMACVIAIIG